MVVKRLISVLSILWAGLFPYGVGAESRVEVLDMRTLGIIPDTGADIVPALRNVLSDLKANPRPVKLRFEKGRYDIHASKTEDTFSYALTLDGIDRISIDGCGARFVCHGPMRVFTFLGCDNITLSDMSFDWERYPFRIVDGKAFFYGETWESQVIPDSYSTILREWDFWPRCVRT